MEKAQYQQRLAEVATQLLAGLLSNPHVYAMVSDEGAQGEQEKKLRHLALDMAKAVIIETASGDYSPDN